MKLRFNTAKIDVRLKTLDVRSKAHSRINVQHGMTFLLLDRVSQLPRAKGLAKKPSVSKASIVLTKKLPVDERFGLTSQLRRAAVSISLNISEGTGRSTDKDFVNFLHIALGSCYEVENLLVLAHDLDFISVSELESMLEQTVEIQKMLNGLIASTNVNIGRLRPR